MAIVAECAVCGKRFKADEKQAGKKARCSQCGTVFVIAAATASGEAAGKVGALAPPKTLAARQPATAPASSSAKVTVPRSTTNAAAPTKVTVSRTAPASEAAPQLAAQVKPAPIHVESSKSPASAAASPPRKRTIKIVALVAVLAVVVGAAAVVVPKMLAAKPATPLATGKEINAGAAQTASHVISVALPPTGPAWAAQPDVAAPTLKLADNFRMAIPAQPPLRHNPTSLVLAAAPSPFVAVTLLPNADRSQPTIEVWNLSTNSKTAQFKLNQPLAGAMLSQDGGYYAGQFYDQDARAMRVEVWATSSGARIHTLDIPSAAPIAARAVLGFPFQDQMAVLGDKLQVWNLAGKKVVREVELPPRSQDTRAAASAKLKLVAIADSKGLTLIDLSQARVLGRAAIPEALLAHPRRRLSLRALEFSPDGLELALLFDNRQATRRIGVYDVATGTLKAIHSPAAPVQSGGPDFQWMGDSKGFLVASGVLLDRDAGWQNGQIYPDVTDEGLGGVLSTLLGDDRALAAWDKYPDNLVLRSLPVRREKADWIKVNIASASAARYEQLQCVSREFGNASSAQALYQSGRLTDGSQFLVVDAKFTASLAPDAPKLLSLRSDRFVLVADGQPRLPIGSVGRDGNFLLEKPESDLRQGDAEARSRSIVFAVSGREKSLALHIASAVAPLEMPAAVSAQSVPPLSGVAWEQLSSSLFNAPDDASLVSVRINSARIRPYELDPEAANHVPLRVTYSTVGARVMSVDFEMTVNTARALSRTARAPRLGLLLPDGTNIHPAIELPDVLPITLGAGERRSHTCLFVFNSQAPRFRLTYDGVPVATITAEPSTAQSTP